MVTMNNAGDSAGSQRPNHESGEHAGSCGPEHGDHADLGDAETVRRAARELKMLARSIVDRLEPLVAQVADTQQSGPYPRTGCAWCPVCAMIALSRGENHELLGYIASHGASLLRFVRALLETSDDNEPSDLLISAFADMTEYARAFAGSMARPDETTGPEAGRKDPTRPDNGGAGHGDGGAAPRRGRFEHIPVLIGS